MPKHNDHHVPTSKYTLTPNEVGKVHKYLNSRDGAFGGIRVPAPGTDPMSPLGPEPPLGGSGPRWPIPYI